MATNSNPVMETIIFFLVLIIVFGSLFVFLDRLSNNAIITEQVYARQIALMIDKAKPGTNMNLGLNHLYEFTKKNNLEFDPVKIDTDTNIVYVKLTRGRGYSYKYFNGDYVVWNIIDNRLNIKIVKKD